MLQYVENIIIPYVRFAQEANADNTLALANMDNFRGQITSLIGDLSEANNIPVCLLPINPPLKQSDRMTYMYSVQAHINL